MMARLQSGEVLPTTSMGDVFLRLGQPVLAGNPALSQLDSKCIGVQSGEACALGEGDPALGVVAAGQFDLHMPFAFAGRGPWSLESFVGR